MPGKANFDQFRTQLRGQLIERDDPAYDAACKVYNGMIHKRPLLIARCADVADVIASVRFGRDHIRRAPARAPRPWPYRIVA